jgi:hypothetical protein
MSIDSCARCEAMEAECTERLREAHSKVQFLVDYLGIMGMLGDGSFTFPDGDTWDKKE